MPRDAIDSPLRILTVADYRDDPNSGAGGTVHYTNQALRDFGHHVDAIWDCDLPRRRIAHGNLHALLEQPRSMRVALLQRVRSSTYDVVQMSQPQSHVAAAALKRAGFSGLLINRSHGVELRADLVMEAWHRRLGVRQSRAPWITRTLSYLLSRQWKGVRRHFDGIVVGCELDRRFLINQAQFDMARVRCIAHGVEPRFLSAPPAARDGAAGRRMLHVGHYAFYKGAYLLVPIVAKVLMADPHATFTWVCDRRSHQSIAGSFSAAIRDRVTLLDVMPIDQLMQVYDRHDIFIFPSLFEGFGKAAVEAMARGLCVVASNEGGMRDCIEHGVTGWLCEVGGVEAFVARLGNCLASPVETGKIASAARAAAHAYSWDACARGMLEFYRRLRIL